MNDISVKCLDKLKNSDLFGSDGFLYTGVQDTKLKSSLSLQFNEVILKFIDMVSSNASEEQLLELLKSSLSSFDRESLETEDAENLTGNFEKIMDCIGLESSDGALNEWMYGF